MSGTASTRSILVEVIREIKHLSNLLPRSESTVRMFDSITTNLTHLEKLAQAPEPEAVQYPVQQAIKEFADTVETLLDQQERVYLHSEKVSTGMVARHELRKRIEHLINLVVYHHDANERWQAKAMQSILFTLLRLPEQQEHKPLDLWYQILHNDTHKDTNERYLFLTLLFYPFPEKLTPEGK